MTPRIALVLIGLFASFPVPGQEAKVQDRDEDFKVYSDAPRLLLTRQRLRLLEREKERQSVRWQRFDSFLSADAPMPEPGFAWALHFRASHQASSAKKALEWALSGQATDLRQLALVLDWCGPNAPLAAKIEKALAAPAADTAEAQDARALAAIAGFDAFPELAEKTLKSVVEEWWRGNRIKRLDAGKPPFTRAETYFAYELFHVIRDNLKIDLRDSAPEYFEELPIDHIASHYPATYLKGSTEYHVPAFTGNGEPDVRDATLSRAAEFEMVALDNNAQEVQFVQGWLMQDRFQLREDFGAPYEFLWANPYQPGLSYEHLPLVMHDDRTGRVFARTSWEEDAVWLGFFDSQLQLFRDGRVQVLRPGSAAKPVLVGTAMLMTAPAPSPDGTQRLQVEGSETVFLLGLTPKARYDVEVDDLELMEAETDSGGTLVIELPEGIQAGVRIRARR